MKENEMKKYFMICFLFLTPIIIAQNKNIESNNKFIRLSNISNSDLNKIDSLYMPAINIDSSKSVFPNKMDSLNLCCKNLFDGIRETLSKNKFYWQKETKVFIRCYFSKNGDIDYFSYQIKDSSFVQYNEFESALKEYVSTFNFGLKGSKKYSQCGSGVFGKKK
jgi:hypothetical protein